MRGNKAFILVVCSLFFVGGMASAVSSAGSSSSEKTVVEKGISPVCTADGDQYSVDMYGDRAVWSDGRNGEAADDIYMYDFQTEEETVFSDLSNHEYHPYIQGETVIWECSNASYQDQVMLKKEGGTAKNISTKPGESEMNARIGERYAAWYFMTGSYTDMEEKLVLYNRDTGKAEVKDVPFDFPYQLEISDNRIAWVTLEGDDLTNAWKLYVYDASTGEFDKKMDLSWSEICLDGDTLTYVESSMTKGYTIKEMDLETGEERKLINLEDSVTGLQRQDDILVWTDERNDEGDSILANNTDIYMYDIANDIEAQITYNDKKQEKPVISGNRIVWVDHRNGDRDIYGYDLSSDVNSNGVADYKEERGVSVKGPEDSTENAAGKTYTYSFWINNTGTVRDTYELNVSGDNNWTTDVASSLSVSADSKTKVQVEVTIPEGAEESEDEIRLKATSENDTSVSDSAHLNLGFEKTSDEDTEGADKGADGFNYWWAMIPVAVIVVAIVVILFMKKPWTGGGKGKKEFLL